MIYAYFFGWALVILMAAFIPGGWGPVLLAGWFALSSALIIADIHFAVKSGKEVFHD